MLKLKFKTSILNKTYILSKVAYHRHRYLLTSNDSMDGYGSLLDLC